MPGSKRSATNLAFAVCVECCVSRVVATVSGVDARLVRGRRANATLDVRVAAIHAASQKSDGRERIVRDLRAQGQRVGHERVRRSLKRQPLSAVYRRPYRVTTDSVHDKPIAPNLLARRFDRWQPQQGWVGDVTYTATAEGWLYLPCVPDLASRRIVGWSMSDRMKAEMVCDALTVAYGGCRPEMGLIAHSDRGSQYASEAYRRLLKTYGMIQSMSRKGNCWDNAVMESFFKTPKVERIDQVRYATRAQVRLDIVNWIEGFHNRTRLHSANGYQTPVDAERALMA